MSQIQASTSFHDNAKTLEELARFIDIFGQDVVRVVNGKLDPSNWNGKLVSVTFTASATDTVVTHGLGRVVSKYVVTNKSAPIDVYDGSTPGTSQVLYLRASGAGTVGLWIF